MTDTKYHQACMQTSILWNSSSDCSSAKILKSENQNPGFGGYHQMLAVL